MTIAALPEAEIRIGDQVYKVRYTMSVLGHLEDALNVVGFNELNASIGKLSFKDMPDIVRAILLGNGFDVPRDTIAMNMDPLHYLNEVVTKIFWRPGDTKDEQSANPRKGQRTK